MIPQLAMLAPSAPPASGRVAGAAGVTANGEEVRLALPFGDLFGAIAGQQQGSDVPASFLIPPVTGALVADAEETLLADVGAGELAPAASELWMLLAQNGLADVNTAAGRQALADAQALASAKAAEPVDPRALLASTLTSSSGEAAVVTSTVSDAAEIIRSLLSTAAQQGSTESAGGNVLATGLQAPLGERSEAAPARLLPLSSPLPPQEARAAFTQTLDQVVWMTREGVHQARLQLEPAHLGRVDIWLDLEGGEAKLHLGAQQVQVREALEAVLPRLRDALAQHGMSLTDASVSDSGRQQPENSDNRESAASGTGFGDDPELAEGGGAEPWSGQSSSSSLLDIYA